MRIVLINLCLHSNRKSIIYFEVSLIKFEDHKTLIFAFLAFAYILHIECFINNYINILTLGMSFNNTDAFFFTNANMLPRGKSMDLRTLTK